METIKTFTGSQLVSNQPLMNDETPNGVADAAPGNVLGVPLVAVADGTALADNLVWCLDKQKVWTVMRRDVTMDISPHWFFGSDSIAVRVTCRVGFGFPHHQAVVQVVAGGS